MPPVVEAAMLFLVVVLIAAAVLEVGGDAAIRYGLVRSAWQWIALGASALVAYGLVVNTSRSIDFGRLLGVYIAVFFVVSQVFSVTWFGERPTAGILIGGALIVAGGAVIQLAAR